MKFIKKIFNKINFKYLFLIIFFITFSSLIYRLLYLEQITGTEFVALIIAIMFACLILNFLNEIQELSIGGNLLKLKEAKSEVNEAIQQLKTFRLETFRLFLAKSIDLPGGWGVGGFIDDRAEKFINLVDLIQAAGVYEELKKEINSNALIIAKGQLRKLLSIDRSNLLREKFPIPDDNKLPDYQQILILVKQENFDECAVYYKAPKSTIEKQFSSAVSSYSKMLDIINIST